MAFGLQIAIAILYNIIFLSTTCPTFCINDVLKYFVWCIVSFFRSITLAIRLTCTAFLCFYLHRPAPQPHPHPHLHPHPHPQGKCLMQGISTLTDMSSLSLALNSIEESRVPLSSCGSGIVTASVWHISNSPPIDAICFRVYSFTTSPSSVQSHYRYGRLIIPHIYIKSGAARIAFRPKFGPKAIVAYTGTFQVKYLFQGILQQFGI